MARHAGADDHGLFEVVVRRGFLVVDVFELVFANANHIAISQHVLLDEPAIDERSIGTVQIFEERVVQNRDDRRVLSTDSEVIDLNVVVGFPTDRDPLLVEVVLLEYGGV